MTDDLFRQFANPTRTIKALALALDTAADLLDADATLEHVRTLSQQVYGRDLELDAPILTDLIIVLVGLLATKLDKTPRQIWEQLWNEAPTDAWWNAHANRNESS